MEEFEDLVPTPDDEGRLELTYRAWSTVDDVIWTMGRTLVFLDLSFNSITNIPDELGDLYQLKELNLACNQVVALPESIGKLNKLNELRANGNKITEIPAALGKCKLLKTIYLSENEIIGVPEELSHCTRLTVLRLQNNNIGFLPHSIALLSITEINVSANKDLEMIPKPMRGNTEIIMWILTNHHENSRKVTMVEQCNMDMLALYNKSVEEITDEKNKIYKLGEQRNELAIERANLHLYLTFKMVTAKAQCTIS